MKKKQKQSPFIFAILIPLLVSSIVSLLSFVTFFRHLEYQAYDLFLQLKPAVKEDPSILLLDIDDLAIAEVGVWPWSRDIMANGLVLLAEFGVGHAVFDIEYVDRSPLGIDGQRLEKEIPEMFNYEFRTINDNIVALFEAIRTRQIEPKDAATYIEDLAGLTDSVRETLLEEVKAIARDNDRILGNSIAVFGNAFLTVNVLPEEEGVLSDEHRAYVLQNVALKNVERQAEPKFSGGEIRPAIPAVLERARGAGFPNVIVDDDGVRRRIHLLAGYRDAVFGQLAFVPLLDYLGNPDIVFRDDSLVLRGAVIPGKAAKDIVIPLAEDGTMLINWPSKKYLDSFRHRSFYDLILHQRLEKNLVHNLEIMEQTGYLDYYEGDAPLLDIYRYADQLRQDALSAADPSAMEEYRKIREVFFGEASRFLTGAAEETIVNDVDAAIASGELDDATRESYGQVLEDVRRIFASTRDLSTSLVRHRETLREEYSGAFTIIGLTGTSTTDIGVNPFESEYMNVGTHAAVTNTILQESFLDQYPTWYAIVAAFVLSLLITLIIWNLSPLASTVVGVVILLVVMAGGTGFFVLTGVYFPMLPPVFAVFFTFVSFSLVKFLRTEQEKSFLRNAFSHYLSTDVINELIKDPDKLNLGGEKKQLTAIFTDVKGFSTVSELLDPTDLVKLLNLYLTDMSNIILNLKGTIDKYEGDAIISFFGAPVEQPDHAELACRAAIRMKKMEKLLNEHFLSEKLTPVPLYTRIGVNTGEMVVGNMGTQQKMDYTIMGNSVNLAARLEGVNKQYGTWILISEATYEEGGKDFTVRMLDRVRVVGINRPVRLYELLDERELAPRDLVEMLERFHEGLRLFEQKEWSAAQKHFQHVLEQQPGDGPAEVYLKRCREFPQEASCRDMGRGVQPDHEVKTVRRVSRTAA